MQPRGRIPVLRDLSSALLLSKMQYTKSTPIPRLLVAVYVVLYTTGAVATLLGHSGHRCQSTSISNFDNLLFYLSFLEFWLDLLPEYYSFLDSARVLYRELKKCVVRGGYGVTSIEISGHCCVINITSVTDDNAQQV